MMMTFGLKTLRLPLIGLGLATLSACGGGTAEKAVKTAVEVSPPAKVIESAKKAVKAPPIGRTLKETIAAVGCGGEAPDSALSKKTFFFSRNGITDSKFEKDILGDRFTYNKPRTTALVSFQKTPTNNSVVGFTNHLEISNTYAYEKGVEKPQLLGATAFNHLRDEPLSNQAVFDERFCASDKTLLPGTKISQMNPDKTQQAEQIFLRTTDNGQVFVKVKASSKDFTNADKKEAEKVSKILSTNNENMVKAIQTLGKPVE